LPEQRIPEELLLGHKIEWPVKSKTHQRNIRPVLVLRENNNRSFRKGGIPFCLDFVKNGKDQLRYQFG
jgi:hypothetical protein